MFCIKCRFPLEEIEVDKRIDLNTILICANRKCNRFGLLTAVFGRLKPKKKKKERKKRKKEFHKKK